MRTSQGSSREFTTGHPWDDPQYFIGEGNGLVWYYDEQTEDITFEFEDME